MGKKSREKRTRAQKRPSGSGGPSRALPLWLLGCLVCVPLLVYARTLTFGFVYDDEFQILRNPWIRDWSHVFRFFNTDVWAFTGSATTNYYRPMHMLIYAVGHSISGMHPAGYHLLNILLHAGSTLLVALIGYRLTQDRLVGIAGGLIFAVHPIHVESVAWIAGVTDPLCAIFYFGALYLYLKDRPEQGNRFAWIAVAGLFLCALLAKEMAFTFPIVAAWLDWCLRRKFRWLHYGAMAGVFAFYAWMRQEALQSFFIRQIPLDLDLYRRILNSIVLLAEYVAKMFVPYGISAFHVFEPVMSVVSTKFALGFAVLAIFGVTAWFLRAQRDILFLFGFSVLTVLPVLNLSGIGENIFADRYLYIPSLGACLLIPTLAKMAWHRHPIRVKLPALRLAGVGLSLLVAYFGFMLWNASAMWRDTATLYQETMKRSPGAALIAANFGRYYFYNGDLGKAEEWFLRSLQLYEQSFIKVKNRRAASYMGLGSVYYRRGEVGKARDFYLRAHGDTPNDISVLQNLGALEVEAGDYGMALKFYQEALAINPRSEITYNNLSAIYLTLKDYDHAITQAQTALGIYPNYSDAYMNLGRAYAAKGMKIEALQAFLRAKQVDPGKSAIVDADLKELDAPSQRKD